MILGYHLPVSLFLKDLSVVHPTNCSERLTATASCWGTPLSLEPLRGKAAQGLQEKNIISKWCKGQKALDLFLTIILAEQGG